jgi:hypothetical protein
MSGKVSFDAPINRHGDINAGYVIFPYDVYELFGMKGQVKKIKALTDGKVAYRGRLSLINCPI